MLFGIIACVSVLQVTLGCSTYIGDNVIDYSCSPLCVESKCTLSKFYKRLDEFSSIWGISVYFFCLLFSTIWRINVYFKVYTHSPNTGENMYSF